MSEWKPIESAPKDGTPFYVWMPGWDGHGPLVRTARTTYWHNSFLNGGMPNEEAFKPTHWMPIVAPPTP